MGQDKYNHAVDCRGREIVISYRYEDFILMKARNGQWGKMPLSARTHFPKLLDQVMPGPLPDAGGFDDWVLEI